MSDYRFKRDSYMDTYNCDIARRGKISGILRQFNETATCNMASARPSYDELVESGRALMVSRMDMEVLEPPHMSEPVEFATWPVVPKGAVIRRCFELKKDGKLLARGASDWALVSTADRRILRMDENTFPNFDYGPYNPIFETKFHISKEIAARMEDAGTHTVGLRDCDCNGHLNNTYYLDILCERIPELFDYQHYWVRSARMHYAKEAPLGSTITIKKHKEGPTYLFQTFLESGELNFECEMTLQETGLRP